MLKLQKIQHSAMISATSMAQHLPTKSLYLAYRFFPLANSTSDQYDFLYRIPLGQQHGNSVPVLHYLELGGMIARFRFILLRVTQS